MSIASKMVNLGGKTTATLEDFQMRLQEEVIELKESIKILMKKVARQRILLEQQREMKANDDVIQSEERKLELLKEELEEARAEYKDDVETLKTVEQILKIREEKRSAKANRIYGAIGAAAIAGGIGLAYGSDTWGTLINKHTMDAVKIAVSRFLPKLV